MIVTTRFAPSPTGHLHLGHAASAFFAFENARASGGRFLVRLEDIDQGRCRPAYAESILEDLRWLGLTWEEPVRRQSEHGADYAKALEELRLRGLLYPCFCTRREILNEAKTSKTAPHVGEEVLRYPRTCLSLTATQREDMGLLKPFLLRLDMSKACAMVGPLTWHDRVLGTVTAHPERFGDIVLARKDTPTSYHLCATLDDALQGVTLVTRGEDLVPSTDVHVLLQKLLNLPTPEYHHHPLLLDAQGKKFSKRDRAVTLASLRQNGTTPKELLSRCMTNAFLEGTRKR